jgi:hypothetical protein
MRFYILISALQEESAPLIRMLQNEFPDVESVKIEWNIGWQNIEIAFPYCPTLVQRRFLTACGFSIQVQAY